MRRGMYQAQPKGKSTVVEHPHSHRRTEMTFGFLTRLSRRFSGFLSLSLGVLVGASAVAQQAPTLVAPGKLTYGVAATFAPFEYTQDGKLTGFDIDFIDAIAKVLKLEPVPLNIEFRWLIPALQGKRVDIINSA